MCGEADVNSSDLHKKKWCFQYAQHFCTGSLMWYLKTLDHVKHNMKASGE